MDLILYSITSILALTALYLNEIYTKNKPNILKLLASIIFSLVFLTDLIIPIYYGLSTYSLHLKPAYTTHVLIACYLFCNITSNSLAFLLGITITICYLLVLGFVTYKDANDHIWEKVIFDFLFCFVN